MSDDATATTKSLLAAAQALEANRDWIGAIGKRDEAISSHLDRPKAAPTPRPADPTNDLEGLGEIHKPSKRHHDYLRHYWRYFRDYRMSARKVVEVGVQTRRSIEMWEEFFPNATIFGIDIDPACAAFGGGRKKIFIGDQMDEGFLLDVIKETGGDFDIVIDDGLHTAYSMMKSFSYLYPALQSHGLYVIEDIMQKPEIIGFFHTLMAGINHFPTGLDLRFWPGLSAFPENTPWLVRNTVGVSFHRYIAFIERGFNPRDNRFLVDEKEYKLVLAERRAEVQVGVDALKSEGLPITRENLLAKLGWGLRNHIAFYLDGFSLPKD